MQIDEARQQQMRQYAKSQKVSTYILSILIGGMAGLFAASDEGPLRGSARWLYRHIPLLQWQPVDGWYPLQVLMYYLIIMISVICFSLLLLFYTRYRRKYYRIPVQPLGITLTIFGRSSLLFLVRWALLFEGMYLFFVIQPQIWWFWSAIVHICILIILSYIGPFRWFSIFTVKPLPEGELSQRIRAWLGKHSKFTYHLFVVDLPGGMMYANAWALGWANNRRIFFSSTLLHNFPPEEIEVILAHELGHHLHRDTLKGLFIRSGQVLVCYFLVNLIALQWQGFSLYDFGGNVFFPLSGTLSPDTYLNDRIVNAGTMLILYVYFVLFSVVGNLFFNLYSQHREFRADEYALQATRNATAFKNAFIRLANANWTIVDPKGNNTSTHPFTIKRLKHADEFAKMHLLSSVNEE